MSPSVQGRYDDQPAGGGPVGDALHGVGGCGERDAFADQRFDRALGGEPGQLGVAGGDGGGVLGRVQAPVQAEDGVVLHEGVVEGGGGDGAAGEADDDDPALEGHALGGGGVRIAADGVVHHVGPAPAGEFLDPGCDPAALFPAPAVDDEVTAELLGDARLGLAPDDPDDGGAGGLAELDGGAADPTGGGVHEQGFAGLDAGPAVQAEPAGLVADVQGGGLGVVEGRGGRQQGAGGRGDVLGEAAVRQARVGDDAAAVLGLAADLDAGREGQRRADLVLAPDEKRVGEVDVRREHLQPHLALAGHRFGNLFEAHGLVGFTGGVYSPCLHPGPPAAVEEPRSAEHTKQSLAPLGTVGRGGRPSGPNQHASFRPLGPHRQATCGVHVS